MALLLSAKSLTKGFGTGPLFENISLTISDTDRLGLIGPNGAGKSTLLQILAGRIDPDSGEVALRKGARLTYVTQESLFPAGETVAQVMERSRPGDEYGPLRESLLTQAGFLDFDAPAESLSGGWRKRLAIVEALATEPDLLLLDEPTNHLDLAGIEWLEDLLEQSRTASVVITHDRYFLEAVSTHVAELATSYPSGLFLVAGPYSEFLTRKEEFLMAQESLRESLTSKMRREVEWLQRGAKARTTKAKARIDSAHALIGQVSAIEARQRTTSVGLDFGATDRKTKKLVQVEKVSYQLNGSPLFHNVTFTLTPGMRLGLVGPNGSGKTTLMRLILDELTPSGGALTKADQLQIVYFAQNRHQQVDSSLTLRRALCSHGDSVLFRGQTIHVNAWAKRFAFRTEQLEQPVGRLSGGERARVQIARLMLESADVLMLDEPTNDLDIPTLETLEENLVGFPGALLLTTHDRYLLDRVSTQVLGLDGDGDTGLYADYRQWEAALAAKQAAASQAMRAVAKPAVAKPASEAAPKKKLSYKEQREWDGMESRILEAEQAVEAQRALMQDPAVGADPKRLEQTYTALQSAEVALESLYARWAELEEKVS